MSQEPSVLLVDLPDHGSPFAQALSQVGRPSRSIAPEQVAEALKSGRPLSIVARARDVSQIAEWIRAQGYPNQLPFFVLQDDAPGSIRPPLPEVTAVVPEAVEPGILALRIQQALQQVGGPRPRQATVLGMGSMSQPPASPESAAAKVSPFAAKSPESAVVKVPPFAAKPLPSTVPTMAPPKESPIATASTKSSAPRAASVEANKAPLRSTPPPIVAAAPEVPWDEVPEPGVVSSTPSVVPKSKPGQSLPSAKPGVFSSAPPLPEIQSLTPSAPFIPEAAPLPPDVQRTLGELSSSPASASPPAVPTESLPTHPPVALNPPSIAVESSADLEAELGQSRRSWLPRALSAAGILAALGAGGMFAMGGDAGEAKSAAEGKDAAPAATPTKSAATAAPVAASAKQSEDKADVAGPTETAPAPEVATGEAAFFQVQNPTKMDTCEVALGKSAADFGSVKKWRATQAWKLARKSLMAGQEQVALEHMCEASFIDASSPATIGLAKYYLGRRGLEQAHSWASKAVDVALGANSKRTAQQVLGDVLSQMGKVDEARNLWLESFNLTADQSARLAPVVRNFINAAVKARKGGDPALAEQLLRRATTFEPDNVNAAALLSATLLENGEKKLAKAWAERALEKKPGLDMAEEVLKSLGG